MASVLETAVSGRAGCRACGAKIAKGEIRFGERVANPFGEGETTWWFHVPCAAYRRPEAFLALDNPEEVEDGVRLQVVARLGDKHPRLARITRAEQAPSGRAKCRHCRENIAKESWRIVLHIWDDGRFNAMGFIHVACAPEYFGTGDIMDRIGRADPAPVPEALAEIAALLPSIDSPSGS